MRPSSGPARAAVRRVLEGWGDSLICSGGRNQFLQHLASMDTDHHRLLVEDIGHFGSIVAPSNPGASFGRGPDQRLHDVHALPPAEVYIQPRQVVPVSFGRDGAAHIHAETWLTDDF